MDKTDGAMVSQYISLFTDLTFIKPQESKEFFS